MPASAVTLRPSTVPAPRTGHGRLAGRGSQRRGAWAHRRAPSLLAAVTTGVALLLIALVTASSGAGAVAASPADPAAHYVTLGGSPGMPELDPANGTIYVPIQCPQSYCPTNAPGRAVDIVDAATCNATNGSACHVVATAPGDNPLGAAVDPNTGTVYVINNGNGTIGVLDGRTCNATVTSGCRHDVATIALGANASIVAGDVDAATRTLYVASPSHGVYVIDIATCNDIVTTGCAQRPELVKDTRGAAQLDIDTKTNTVYVADNGNPNADASGNGNTVTVINGNTCDAKDDSGCGENPPTVTAGSGVSAVAVDQANDTVYVANYNDGTVSVIDGARCNSLRVSGCHAAPRALRTGAGTADVVVDAKDDTVFALNQGDDTLSSIDAATCDGTRPSACPPLAPAQREAPEVGPGAFGNDVIVTPGNDTAYVVNEGGANVLIVTGVGGCTGLDHSACLVPAPSVPEAGQVATLDPATGTLYVTDENLPQVDVIDAAHCDPARLSGCAPVGTIPTGGQNQVGSVDDATHTLYVSEAASKSVAVINTASCNATDVAGCAAHHASIPLRGEYPNVPLLDGDTGSLYVSYGANADEVAVADTRACNAEVTSGCRSPRGRIEVLEGTYTLALDAATDTIYAATSGNPFASGYTVAVINGASCVGDMAGCGKLAATIALGPFTQVVGGPAGPDGMAVDEATHTLYVADNHDGDLPGRLTLVDTETCNGFVTSGCAEKFPTVFVGRSPLLAELDAQTGILYVTNYSSTDVSVLDTARCNALEPAGCAAPVPEVNVGSQPNGLAIDELTGTVYVLSLGTGTMSLLRG